MIRALAQDTTLWSDDVWVVDSTPVECGRSRDTVKRSDLAGWAQYGYCASHSRYFWGLRLHLVCTLAACRSRSPWSAPRPATRRPCCDILAAEPALLADRPGQTLIGDKNYFGARLRDPAGRAGAVLLRPARKGEPERGGSHAVQTAAPDHRIDQPDLQRPARPGTPRRPHLQRRRRPRPATHPRADRRDLAQRQDRRTDPPFTDRLRPLTTPWTQSSRRHWHSRDCRRRHLGGSACATRRRASLPEKR